MFAPSIGPTLGGYIAEHLGWRALFWINLPPALLATFLVWRNMKGLAQGEFSLLKRVDLSGLIGLALFLGGAQYVLEEGPAKGWFESSELVLLTCVSACGAALFFYRAVKYDNPIVDLRPFKHFTFAVASALGFIIGVGMFAPIFLTPLFLSTVRGYNAFQIGETMFVQGVVMMCFSPCMGLILNRFPDVRPIGALGFLLMAASCWLQGGLTAQAGFADLVLPQILRGFGLAMAYVSVTQPALYCLPIELVHFGSGLFNTIRNIGGAFGIAFMTTLHNHAFALHRQELYSALDPQNPHVQQMLSGMQAYLEQTGARDPSRQALMNYAGVLDREALVMTFNDQFHLITIALIVSASAMLLLKPVPKKLGGQPKEEPANAAFEGEAEATT
jgi:DHA2 family multidrug resistance protein